MKVSDQIATKAINAIKELNEAGAKGFITCDASFDRPPAVVATFRTLGESHRFYRAFIQCGKVAAMLAPPVEAEFEVKAEAPAEPKWEPKPGDWVTVRKPKDIEAGHGPWWNEEFMDYLDGAVVRLVKSDLGVYPLACKRASDDGCQWHLHRDWLSPAEAPKAEDTASAAPSVDADLAAEAFEALEQMVNAFSAKTEYMNTVRRNAARLTAMKRAVSVAEKVKAVKP